MATEAAVAQAYIADINTEMDRATGIGNVGAALGAGFIIGPAIGRFLSIHHLSTLGFAAVALNEMCLLFAFLFLPESNEPIQMFTNSDYDYWRRLATALTKPLIVAALIILLIITLAFSTILVIVPFLGITSFGFGEVGMSYFFMYIGMVQIILQGTEAIKFINIDVDIYFDIDNDYC